MKKGVILFISILAAGMWLLEGGICAAIEGAGSDPVASDELSSVYTASGYSGVGIVIEQVITENTLDEVDTNYSAKIVDSGDGTAGIVQINQAAGNINNQANVFAGALNAELDDILSGIQFEVSAVESDNEIINSTGDRKARIRNSFNEGCGVVQINQSAGSVNNQFNLVAVTVGKTRALPKPLVTKGMEGMTSLSEMELGSVTGVNETVDAEGESGQGVNGVNGIPGSFQNFHGIVQVNQTEGNQNTIMMQTLVSVQTVHLK